MQFLTIVIIASLSLILLAAPAHAASTPELTRMEIEAGKYAVAGDFRSAIAYYNRILSVDGSNTDVYLQRALMYRELGDITKSQTDAAIALDLLERKFAAGQQKASLYRQRANAKRLLKKFPEAKADMETAIRMSNSNKWVPDLQAIYLEEKMYTSK